MAGQRDRGVLVFRGVPYARPPVGPLRYRKPEPPTPSEGVRSCESYGARSLQGSARRGQAARVSLQSEDCLTLNLWTPALDDGARAVLVYIHGGGYVVGSGNEEFQDGSAFAADDVVFVTLNHRLAGLGFLHIDELFDGFAGTGNLGLWDTVRALEWVQENIAAFGGDPGRVTLAGHSSGAITISALLASPRARGLFRAAIPISSASGHSWIEPEAATAVARRVLASVGIAPGDREDLLRRPAEQLILSADLYDELYDVAGGHPFEPVLDGDLLEAPPIEAIRAGAGAEVALLIGHMAEEFRLCVFDDRGAVRDPPLNMGVRCDGFDHRRLTRPTGLSEQAVLDVYARSLAASGRELSDPEIFAMAASDVVMLRPGAALAAAHAAHQRSGTWAYRFAWRPPAGDGRVGACHGIDIPYFFERLDAPFWAPLYEGQGDAALARRYRRTMVAMAKTGSPEHPDLPPWPAWDPERRANLVFDSTVSVVDDPDGERRALFDAAPPYGYPGAVL